MAMQMPKSIGLQVIEFRKDQKNCAANCRRCRRKCRRL